MTQIKRVYEFVLGFFGDTQRKSERFDKKRKQDHRGSWVRIERVKKRMKIEKKNGGVYDGGAKILRALM